MTTLDNGSSRRNFLKLAGTVAPAAALVVASGAQPVEATEVDTSKTLMQDTVHTRAYFASAKF